MTRSDVSCAISALGTSGNLKEESPAPGRASGAHGIDREVTVERRQLRHQHEAPAAPMGLLLARP